jgi:hypothetical protein
MYHHHHYWYFLRWALLAAGAGGVIVIATLRAMRTGEGAYDAESRNAMYWGNLFALVVGLALLGFGVVWALRFIADWL